MFKKLSVALAIIVSLLAIYQGGGLFFSTYAKAADLSSLQMEVHINALKQDVQYVQDRVWQMEDRYGYQELNDQNRNIPKSVLHRYQEYSKQLKENSELLKILMIKRMSKDNIEYK